MAWMQGGKRSIVSAVGVHGAWHRALGGGHVMETAENGHQKVCSEAEEEEGGSSSHLRVWEPRGTEFPRRPPSPFCFLD